MRHCLAWLAVTACSTAMGQQAVVWVASPWEHVLKSTEPGAARAAEIVAARNEYEPFRIIVRAGEAPLTDVRVEASALEGPGGRIGSENVSLFREHYVDVFAPSYASKAPTGWYPDPLIPMALEGTPAGAKYPGTPFDIEPGQNQGVWVDVYVPKTASPGEYTGTVTVTSGGETIAQVPVKLTVRAFSLPDTIAMRSNFGGLGGGLARRLGLDPASDQFRAVEDEYIDTMLKHRAIPSSLGSIWPKWTPEGGIDDSQTGERMRQMVEDRHVNALAVPFAYRDDPEKCRAYLRDMAAYLKQKGWLDLAYIYMEDEPNNAEQYETVRRQGEMIRESGIKRMCTEQTRTSNAEWGDLYGAVDIWCPLWYLHDEATGRERQALGEKLWSYTALCQGPATAPFWQIDFPPVVFRSPFWTSWHYDIEGFLYWSSIYWTPEQDVWTTPHFRDRYWGEGMLLYPGTEAGISGPVTSIRLKLIREALEDFEYMTLAAAQGQREQVNGTVDGLARSFTDWEHSPDAYMAAREQLAGLIKGE